MFNRYFEAGENSIEFLFAHITVKNIDFALISLSCLLDGNNINYDLYHDDHTYYFFIYKAFFRPAETFQMFFMESTPDLIIVITCGVLHY